MVSLLLRQLAAPFQQMLNWLWVDDWVCDDILIKMNSQFLGHWCLWWKSRKQASGQIQSKPVWPALLKKGELLSKLHHYTDPHLAAVYAKNNMRACFQKHSRSTGQGLDMAE